MRSVIRVVLAGLFCVVVAGGAVFWLTSPNSAMWHRSDSRRGVASTAKKPATAQGGERVYELNLNRFEDGGYQTALAFAAPIHDDGSLQELRESVRGRGRRGITELRRLYDQLRSDTSPTKQQLIEKASLEQSIGFLYMYEGKFLEATTWLEKSLATCQGPDLPAAARSRLQAVLGIVAMRRGEVENCLECVGPSSCIFPIAREAVHQNQGGSRDAVRWFTAYLENSPRDLRIIWLLNIAYMTLGEYPENVPPQYLISSDIFRSKANVGHFENVASPAGLTSRGPNLAGGSIFDDFNNDGLPDLLTTSLDADLGASLFINRGDGTFDDRSAAAGLGSQIYALNITRADFDNDGNLDVLLLRGG
jgi:tetratricopeptide (TPR) repeat protein